MSEKCDSIETNQSWIDQCVEPNFANTSPYFPSFEHFKAAIKLEYSSKVKITTAALV